MTARRNTRRETLEWQSKYALGAGVIQPCSSTARRIYPLLIVPSLPHPPPHPLLSESNYFRFHFSLSSPRTPKKFIPTSETPYPPWLPVRFDRARRELG